MPCFVKCCIGGDAIIAKVTRDHAVLRLHVRYLHYGWQENAVYAPRCP